MVASSSTGPAHWGKRGVYRRGVPDRLVLLALVGALEVAGLATSARAEQESDGVGPPPAHYSRAVSAAEIQERATQPAEHNDEFLSPVERVLLEAQDLQPNDRMEVVVKLSTGAPDLSTFVGTEPAARALLVEKSKTARPLTDSRSPPLSRRWAARLNITSG